MELSKIVEQILEITNESPYGRLDMDSSEAGEIWELLNKELEKGQSLPIDSVSDCKKLNIHECLNDLEKVIEVKTGVLDFIDKGSLRYQLKKAIDKMICCR